VNGVPDMPEAIPRTNLRHASPAELVRDRCRAFAAGDFGFIYDSYHADALFRQHFPDRSAYLAYGRATLSAEFRIRECRVLKERVGGERAQLLFYLDSLYRGERVETVECALLLRTEDGWRYHSGQKLSREELPAAIEDVDWSDFERAGENIRF